MQRLLPPLTLLVLTACAAPPPSTTTDDAVSCQRETRVGSNLPTTRCRSAAQREADRRAAEAAGESIRPGAATRDAGS